MLETGKYVTTRLQRIVRGGLTLALLTTAAMAASACGGSDGAGYDTTVAIPRSMLPPPTTNADGLPPAVPFFADTPRDTARSIASFPHDTAAYTQGLLIYDGRLLESTGLEGKSDIREVVRASGKTAKTTVLPNAEFGEGMAALGGRLYQLTWKGGRGHVYDAKSLVAVDSFTFAGEGWGITSDGTQLYTSDGSSHIRVVNPQGFQTVRTIDVTENGRAVYMLNELEWVRGELWANIYQTDYIARIDPATGHVTRYLYVGALLSTKEKALVMLHGGTANGIALDSARQRVLLTGKLWPRVFEIAAPK